MIQGKIWGWTSPLIKNEFVQMHRIHIVPGGVCSKHLHEHRHNGFYCMKGHVIIRSWVDEVNYPEEPDETVLLDGQFTVVPPGVNHQFEAVLASDVIELYWPESLKTEDIMREAAGYLNV